MTVSGSVLFRERVAVPPGAIATVKLVDTDGEVLAAAALDASGVPVLGICFGGQALASVLAERKATLAVLKEAKAPVERVSVGAVEKVAGEDREVALKLELGKAAR